MKKRLVLLVRHGIAVDAHPSGDASRPLTAEGRDLFRRHAKRLAKDLRIERIVTSPLVRAVQTAELLAQAFDVDEVEVDRLLEPEADVGPFVKRIEKSPAGTAYVGHNPSMTEAARKLLGESALPFRFKKGAVLELDLDGEPRLRGFHKP